MPVYNYYNNLSHMDSYFSSLESQTTRESKAQRKTANKVKDQTIKAR